MKAALAPPSPPLRKPPPAQAVDMPASLVWLFAAASGLSVANVYYAQPLLDALARDFAIRQATVGGVVTATQIGCALALLLLVPLGDLLERRRLMAAQLLALVAALTAVAMRALRARAAGRRVSGGLAGHGNDAGADRLRGQRRRAP
ncbi:hypothetical protein JOS77_08280 [Chromobacterium haemolyticum]|nr:hypothetical protein JOS77_08280 [Chromobacterium haemolyticum]